jgi:hypothetical protein
MCTVQEAKWTSEHVVASFKHSLGIYLARLRRINKILSTAVALAHIRTRDINIQANIYDNSTQQILLENPNSSDSLEITRILWNQKVNYRVRNSLLSSGSTSILSSHLGFAFQVVPLRPVSPSKQCMDLSSPTYVPHTFKFILIVVCSVLWLFLTSCVL